MLRHTVKYVYTCRIKSVSFTSNHFISLLQKQQFLKPNLRVLNVLRTFSVSKVSAAKLFHDHENAYAFSIVNKESLDMSNTVIAKSPLSEVTTLEEFNDVLNQNWRHSSSTEIVNAFRSIKKFCVDNGINVSDHRFDKLVDGLMDHCEKLSDTELFDLLQCLLEIPPSESATSHNFHDIWSCLDDICCWKVTEWDLEKMFKFANIWYKLNLGK